MSWVSTAVMRAEVGDTRLLGGWAGQVTHIYQTT
jgi:hypothetical protein